MGFGLTCPRCGHSYQVGIDLQRVSFKGNGMNVVVPCPRCGHEWDATGGGDGTWSAVGGRLVRVARAVSQMERGEVQALRARLQEAETARDADTAAKALSILGVEPPTAGWRDQGNRMELWAVVTLLLTVLSVLLPYLDRGEGVTPEQIERIIDETQKGNQPAPPERTQRKVGRNQLCPCGSGAKFKRCHGSRVPPETKAPRH